MSDVRGFCRSAVARGRIGERLSESIRLVTIVAVVLLGVFAARISTAAPPAESAKKRAPEKEGKSDAAATDKDAKDKPGDGDPADLPANPFPERFKAPELDGGNGWLN